VASACGEWVWCGECECVCVCVCVCVCHYLDMLQFYRFGPAPLSRSLFGATRRSTLVCGVIHVVLVSLVPLALCAEESVCVYVCVCVCVCVYVCVCVCVCVCV
jgi:hypothetical protein